MKARFIRFGLIEIDGRPFDRDVVVENGEVRRRRKKPSKPYRESFGHTPLSVDEKIPWPKATSRLIVGTGADGQLPIMSEVLEEARERGVEIVARTTDEACRLISAEVSDATAILHVTC